jgi:hypothetical protein
MWTSVSPYLHRAEPHLGPQELGEALWLELDVAEVLPRGVRHLLLAERLLVALPRLRLQLVGI